ncbi:hypothetical protein CLPUN_04300 [Clostridium puniceum]|uniref:Uncharacterized protein n=1 Tax=Clostridium puniceum TaxID=29367 RepID=A0A1S8TX43_9CLOT|nr:hypothetical protein [Clostridium puniceum]OOM82291.1 hypothetical protein CLPUN_04300 [Clostridium puniceum]
MKKIVSLIAISCIIATCVAPVSALATTKSINNKLLYIGATPMEKIVISDEDGSSKQTTLNSSV